MERKAYWRVTVWGDEKELASFCTEALTKEEAKAVQRRQREKWRKRCGASYEEYFVSCVFLEWE